MSNRRQILAIALLALTATGLGVLASLWMRPAAGPPAPLAAGTRLDPPRPLPAFTLTDQRGQPFGAERFRGHWSLVFFGFTSCPEVCPTTLALLADVRRQLGAGAPDLVFVSVDPERDTPERLAAYLPGFDAGITGLTGNPDALATLAGSLGVLYRRLPGPDGEYMMDHSVAVQVVDPKGGVAAVFTPPFTTAGLVADLRILESGD